MINTEAAFRKFKPYLSVPAQSCLREEWSKAAFKCMEHY